ncbi:hypothetical protein [Wolbachia endosymbiont (group A) of Urophora cardui]|uniref:hypothetical protein n=1 Tax=Wolbachia endosymbiont (group A) of Urophora cardui TaxID=3066156 RepID=UPI0039785E98
MINNFLGIDVSKERFDVFLSFISKKGKRETRKRKFKNDDSGWLCCIATYERLTIARIISNLLKILFFCNQSDQI